MKKKKGIALLVTLTITLLVSISVKSLIEETSAEIKLLSNYQNSFRAESMARSMFRILIRNIQDFGASQVFAFMENQFEGVPYIPFEEGYLSKPEFIPMDHYYYINQKFGDTGASPSDYFTRGQVPSVVFKNLYARFVNEFKLKDEYIRKEFKIKEKKDENLYAELEFISEVEISQAIGAMIDWQDSDDFPFEKNGFIGQEFYYKQEEDEVDLFAKNQPIEYPEELRVVPAFEKLKIFDFIESHQHKFPFLVYQLNTAHKGSTFSGGTSTCHFQTGKLNINMLKRQIPFLPPNIDPLVYQMEGYLSQFIGIGYDYKTKEAPCDYQYAEEIVTDGTTLFTAIAQKIYEGIVFKPNLKKDKNFETLLRDSGFELNDPIVNFFTGKSEMITLTFSITLGAVTKTVISHLRLNGNDDKPSSIDIEMFRLI